MIIAKRKNAWDTDEIIRIGGDFYLRTRNGGYEGAREVNNSVPDILSTELLERREAVRWLLDLGNNPKEVEVLLRSLGEEDAG